MLKTITILLAVAVMATICLPLQGGEPMCGSDARNAGRGSPCPHCGCCLVPVCHISCTTKKVTEYKYGCRCEDLCIPGVTPIGKKGQSCEASGQCAGQTGNNGCQEGCGGRCLIHEVHKLVKKPQTKEVPVRTCTVEWVCPSCGCHGDCQEGATPSR
jgi:hypothetical protein